MEPADFQQLQLLLKAPSKKFLTGFLEDVFLENAFAPSGQEEEVLGLDSAALDKLAKSTRKFIRTCLYETLSEPAEIVGIFPANFHADLSKLLARIVIGRATAWRDEIQKRQISIPRLVDVDWRIDVKVACDEVPHMNVPTTLMFLKVQDPLDVALPPKSVSFELTRETLNTMLDGLKKIQEQLGSLE